MELTIRDSSTDVWPAICKLHDRARPGELRGSFDARTFVPLAEDPEGATLAACEVFVARDGDEVIGFAGIDVPYLAWLYVDPAHYRRGVGRALLDHCLERLGEDAWTISCGNNTAALDLYLGRGFSVEKRFTGNNAGYEGPVVRLALDPEARGWLKPKRSDGQAEEHLN